MNPSLKRCILLSGLAFAATAVRGQQFDVVSIRPTPAGARNSGYRRSPAGVLNATNVTLKMLISYGYDVKDYQIAGGPGWVDTERYEVLAKSDPAQTEPASSMERMTLMRARVRAMLADRFQLTLHKSTKDLPIFVLTVAKNGPKGLNEPKSTSSDLIDNGHHVTCHKTSLDSFTKIFLQGELGRPVVNKTDIQGEFDFAMEWTPDESLRHAGDDPGPATAPNPDGPEFFTAIEEQLGLKLAPSKGPVDILMIDRAEKASEN